MTLETGTYFDDWHGSGTPDYPENTSDVSEVDDHVRDIKQRCLNHFPYLTAALSVTHTELNYLDGVLLNLAVSQKGTKSAGIKTTGGSSTAYTLTTGESITPADGMRFTMQLHISCGADPTLQVIGGSAYDLVDKAGDTFALGELQADQVIEVMTDVTNTVYRVIGGMAESTAFSPTQITAYTNGDSGTFTVPVGITRLKMIAIGGGGGGGAGASGAAGAGGGGGGGGYSEVIIPVSPGDSISYWAGSGGAGGTSGGNGIGGGSSSVTASVVSIIAYGGGGGKGEDNSGTGGTAGTTYYGGSYVPNEKDGGTGGAGGGSSDDGGGGGGSSGGLGGSGANGSAGDTDSGGAGADGSTTANGGTGGDPGGQDGDDTDLPVSETDVNSGGGGAGSAGATAGGDGGDYGAGGGGTGGTATGGVGGVGIVAFIY